VLGKKLLKEMETILDYEHDYLSVNPYSDPLPVWQRRLYDKSVSDGSIEFILRCPNLIKIEVF